MKSNPFSRFYNTDVKLIKIKVTGAYSKTSTVTELSSIKADVQPYNGGLAEKEYGLVEECQLRMFCDNNEHISVGNYAQIHGQRYRIIYSAPWNFGAVVILQRVTV